MKKFLFLCLVHLFLIYPSVYCQLIWEENFSYISGRLDSVSGGNWIKHTTNSSHIPVLEGNLSYPGYKSSLEGNYIYLRGTGTDQWLKRSFNNITKGSVYVSFLMSVKDNLNLDLPGVPFIGFVDIYESPRCYVCIKKTTVEGIINLGIRKGGAMYFSPYSASITDTILVVMKYSFFELGSDTLSLWVNPPLSDSEPIPDIIDFSTPDSYGMKYILLRPTINSGNIFIDGIRVSTDWTQAPLPVELSLFTASKKGDEIELRWKTETELDNYGFEVERKIRSSYKNQDWEKINFIRGSGNSNSPRYYSCKDKSYFNFSIYSYRLKQVDNDGSFSYSKEVHVEVNNPANFNLKQNFPNPFNPETELWFSIPDDGSVSLSLYNILGQKVRNVVNGFYKAGNYEVSINSSNLTSGIYFCVLEWGKLKKTIKMVVDK